MLKPSSWLRHLIEGLEPWYDWGTYSCSRMDERGDGELRYFEFEWLGLKGMIVLGRMIPVDPRFADEPSLAEQRRTKRAGCEVANA